MHSASSSTIAIVTIASLLHPPMRLPPMPERSSRSRHAIDALLTNVQADKLEALARTYETRAHALRDAVAILRGEGAIVAAATAVTLNGASPRNPDWARAAAAASPNGARASRSRPVTWIPRRNAKTSQVARAARYLAEHGPTRTADLRAAFTPTVTQALVRVNTKEQQRRQGAPFVFADGRWAFRGTLPSAPESTTPTRPRRSSSRVRWQPISDTAIGRVAAYLAAHGPTGRAELDAALPNASKHISMLNANEAKRRHARPFVRDREGRWAFLGTIPQRAAD
jgi:hypothetical protein